MVTDARSSRRGFVRSIAGASLLSLADGKGKAKDSIPLAVPGKQPYSIFLSTEASPSERWAAEELRRHIEQMTGSRMPIDIGAGVPVSPRAIAIGRSGLTDSYDIKPPQGESCLLKTSGETVIIAGGRQRGTMYGVSILLEKLGCRWFTPDVTQIPRTVALWMPELDEVHIPGFEYREVFFTEAQGREWSARNRLNGNFHRLDEGVGGKVAYVPWAHSFYDLVPPDRYFESHPEYFALVSGQRQRQGAQLCLTNAEVLRLAVEQTQQWLVEHPDASVVSVSQNDTDGWCECEPCRQVVKEEGGAISGLALRFVNQVAERVAVSHPGKLVDMLAYQDTADPPSTVRPLANVQIRLCPIDACQAHSVRTCVYNRPFRERLEQWSRIAPKLHIWQYSVNFSHYLAPFPNYDELTSDIPMFQRAGISGLFIQGAVSEGGGGDDAELRSYLAARLLWQPDLDPVAEIRGFLDAVYGPAAPLLWNYFVLRQQEVRRGQHLWIDQSLDARYLTPAFLKQARALLGRALLRVATEEARRRIERHLLSIDYVEAMREKRCVIQGESYGPADPARAKDDTQKLLKTAEELGVTHLREDYPIAQQAKDWGDVAARYRALVLTDGAANATVIPELGRVIALGWSNRERSNIARSNILRVPDPGEWAYPHIGGIYVSLSDGSPTAFRLVEWRLASASRESVTLTGRSDAERAIQMQIGIAENVLKISVTVSNPTDSPARVAILCRAEFACGSSREAVLTHRDRSGKLRSQRIRLDHSAPGGSGVAAAGSGMADGSVTFAADDLLQTEGAQQEWALACESPALRVRNRFRPEEVARCAFSWSFRGSAGLSIKMTVVSPEVELAPGQQFALTSDYDLIDFRLP
jgi:Domain of unknown function (DUF4838)